MTEEEELLWSGMHRAASEALVHATRKPTPAEISTQAGMAIQLGLDAIDCAATKAQQRVSRALVLAAIDVKIDTRDFE